MNLKKISIITVCFNSAETIEDTLISVSNQSHKLIEHIVIDGNSTDGTQAIIEKYKQHITHFISEPDKGIYDAMNKGIKIATGDIIGILNSDDIYATPHILEQIATTMSEQNLEAIYGDVMFFESENKKANKRRFNSSHFSAKRISWGWMPAHPTLFLTKNIYEKYGDYKLKYKIASDFEFIVRIFQDETIKYKYIPQILVRMRLGGVSTSGLKNTLLLNQEVLRACKENGIKTNIFKILSKYPRKFQEYFKH